MSLLSAPLVLASASPRRRAILTQLALEFRVVPPDVDETPRPGERADDFVQRAARDKAASVAEPLATRDPAPWVLGSDTAVVLGVGAAERLLGKPRDDEDALGMLMDLSGRAHRVVTGVAVVRAGEADVATTAVGATVRFRALTEQVARAYVQSGEGRDKAGAYAVQGLGAGLVESVEGPYHTVVGLPAAQTLALLEKCGALLRWP